MKQLELEILVRIREASNHQGLNLVENHLECKLFGSKGKLSNMFFEAKGVKRLTVSYNRHDRTCKHGRDTFKCDYYQR